MKLTMPQEVEKLERSMIDAAMLAHGGNKAHAAKYLGINRTTLVEKMRKYGYRLNKRAKPVE